MILHKILCEICEEPLARAYLPNLVRPLTAGQFVSLGKGYPPPFPDPSSTWEWLVCPHCRNRPFITTETQIGEFHAGNWPGPEEVKTDKGMYRIYSSNYPGIPPQINIQVHTDEELEAEWKAREKKPAPKKQATTTLGTKGVQAKAAVKEQAPKKKKK